MRHIYFFLYFLFFIRVFLTVKVLETSQKYLYPNESILAGTMVLKELNVAYDDSTNLLQNCFFPSELESANEWALSNGLATINVNSCQTLHCASSKKTAKKWLNQFASEI